MTVDQVASYLNKDPKTIQNLASLKKIHRVKRGSTTFYPKSEIDKSEYVGKKKNNAKVPNTCQFLWEYVGICGNIRENKLLEKQLYIQHY